ncbi:unnamed protein product [Prunus armeniaca]|uniref:Neprosin activation peptide domain-containing protein n=1 Tax=Prunus armeniaca TaxID=36596 RepID=A0A6J5WLR0_PRUAR|nr:hypothetical protein GBA52_007129 [Prunus armeniaca]CAB4270487.1 unnamed protein product [Prunus armeniaca]CAB4300887.1 unnamed protein product [Prunus armeniaca]
MSFKILISMFFLLLVLLAPPPSLIQSNFEGLVVAAIRPLEPIPSNSNPSNYVPVKAYKKGHGGAANGFGSHIVESCLPKGSRRSSAPSHYANGQTFGSELCSSSKRMNRP